ncbi:MAG: T9SS type A sorting domain-containing protein [Saprospiraceae bacterium]|nr:T9SS type A sorting domain-containing protein [Candidatus Vicinibacter affinis]MBK6571536.1 T9SS type A sorting domain-containing protein [Candidatus Vicinibacter affinis]MBK7800308.1 T9SS type A sorting domain-containing protein [Candidatus Vicinibacter affinis]MBP7305881.1 T9SS type A sorting domain-containing protein [Saprospiraceae bacterium]
MKYLLILLFLNTSYLLNAQCWSDLSIGRSHVLALKSDGSIWTWGENRYGQLGIRNTVDHNKPVQVGLDKDWKSIETGSDNCFAIKNDGTLWAWGYNSAGELGIESMSTYKNKPIQVGLDKDWEFVSSGSGSTFGIKKDGTLWGWGAIFFATSNQLKPIQYESENNWKSVSNCSEHILFLKNNGTLWSIGKNYYGQLGIGIYSNGVDTLSQIGFNDDWELVHSSPGVSFGLVAGGALWIWGRLNNNQNRQWNMPVDLYVNKHYWNNITANTFNFFGVRNDGSLWGCGNNDYGQLSNGSKDIYNDPTQIGSENNWKKVVVGTYGNTFAIKKDGTLWACGLNDLGQLGIGSNTDTLAFTQIICPVVNSVGNLNSVESEISIYPNPVDNILTIDFGVASSLPLNISISDVNGNCLYSKKLDILEYDQQWVIDMSSFATGLYFVKVNFKKDFVTNKFIKI